MPYRFIHTADLHLDSPLGSLAMRDADLAAAIDTATREVFAGLVERCLEERVDALMIAGDLYDGTQTSVKTGLFLVDQLGRLSAAGIRTFIVRGNHDAASAITKGLELPEGVHVFDGRGGAGEVAREGEGPGAPPVLVHGVSFAQRHAPDSLLPRYARPTEGAIEIALMHTSLGGDAAHDAYAPCALADLAAHGFSYWGLGHVHARAVHHEAGDCAVVMPGMPQGRDVGEAGAKSATLVTVADDRSVHLEEIASATTQFERERLALAPEDDWDAALERAEEALAAAASRAVARRLVARLDLSGASVDAWRLRRDRDLFVDELRARVAGGDLHVEDVRVDVAAPEAKAAASHDAMGPVAELAAQMARIADTPDFREWAREHAGKMRTALPSRELREAVFGDDEDALLDLLAHEGAATLAARLEGDARGRADGEVER